MTVVDDSPAAPAIDVRGLRVSYGRRTAADALRGVDLRLERGGVVAIVGASGSGKSSLASALLGLHHRGTIVTAERLHVLGRDMAGADERRWRALRRGGVSLVPQDPLGGLDPAMRIGAQVRDALIAHWGRQPDDDGRVRQLLRDAGLDLVERRMRQYPHELSGGQRQRVLIAIALAGDPQLIVADEPTSALDVTVQRRILDHLGALVRDRGIALVLITHDLGVAAERADSLLVLDDGAVVEHGPTRRILAAPRAEATRMLREAAPSRSPAGALVCARYPGGRSDLVLDGATSGGSGEPGAAAPPLVSIAGVTKTYARATGDDMQSPALDDVTLDVLPGETVGVVGESGSGKSTLLRVALALTQPDSGAVTVGGSDLAGIRGARLRTLRRRFQLVQQDPSASLDPRYTVARCIAEPLDAARIGTRAERRSRAERLLDLVGLPADVIDRSPLLLSGGQRQRVAIARAIAAEPEVVYLDEPLSSLDVTVQRSILDTLVELQRRLGVAYVFVSHDLAAVARIAHRVVVMRDGRIVETGTAPEVLGSPRTPETGGLIAAIPRPLP